MKRTLSQLAVALLGIGAGLAASPDIAAWLAGNALEIVTLVAAVLALGVLPGLALLNLLWQHRGDDRDALTQLERLTLAICLSVALPPILLLLARTLGLAWGTAATIGYVLVSALLALAGVQRRGADVTLAWPTVVFAALSLVVIAARLHLVRDLPAGMFGDSYHHTMIAQLLVNNGGLFSSWQPYAELTSFTYHFGFHAQAAFLHWLSGASVLKTTLVIGQAQSALAMAGAYVLAARLCTSAQADDAVRERAMWAGFAAAALVAFVNPVPAYFVNWGRYTQQAGQLLLPGVIVCWMRLIDARSDVAFGVGGAWRAIVLCGVATAGLMLTHYIVTGLAALCVAAYLLYAAGRAHGWRVTADIAARVLPGVALAALIALPWLLTVTSGYLARNTVAMSTGGVAAATVAQYSALTPIAPDAMNIWALRLAILGALLAAIRREWRPLLLMVWSGLIMLAIVPNVIGLPGAGVVDRLTGYIALYVTLLPLAGSALATMIEWLRMRIGARQRWVNLAGVASIATLAWWGIGWQSGLLNRGFQLLTPADVEAMTWLRSNTPADARFLVAASPGYGGALIAGTDGGWWLPMIAARKSTLPPITYASERGIHEDRAKLQAVDGLWIKLRGRRLTDPTPVKIDASAPDKIAVLRSFGVTHIYDGANIPANSNEDALDIDALKASMDFTLIYDKDGVRIFELRE